MRKLRVYIDTSVIGGCLDPEFSNDSVSLMEQFKSQKMIAILSETLFDELEKAPKDVQNIINQFPKQAVEEVSATQEAVNLAKNYVSSGAIPQHSYSDALHIAIASVHDVDVLVSWNFKHIVNLNRIHAYNSVNLKEGYKTLEIRSPKEVLENGN